VTTRDAAYELYEDDWQHVDGIETVTLIGHDAAEVAGVKAKRRNLSFGELSAGGSIGVEPGDEAWSIWDNTITGGVDPKPEFKLRDAANVTYTLTSVTGQQFGTIWRCTARKHVS